MNTLFVFISGITVGINIMTLIHMYCKKDYEDFLKKCEELGM